MHFEYFLVKILSDLSDIMVFLRRPDERELLHEPVLDRLDLSLSLSFPFDRERSCDLRGSSVRWLIVMKY